MAERLAGRMMTRLGKEAGSHEEGPSNLREQGTT